MTTTNVVRKNAWNNGGTFDNLDLLWYAKAVGVMKSRPITDPTSWWFYAAIHGQSYIDNTQRSKFPDWTKIKSILPSAQLVTGFKGDSQTATFWDQCQHHTHYFLPWHRGYLVAIETILREIIIHELKGRPDWGMPYWNYFKDNKTQIPPAFTALKLPKEKGVELDNPLYIPERYGPNGDGNVHVEVSGTHKIKETCQDAHTDTASYMGQKVSEFTHFNNSSGAGALEHNPHDFVHVSLGGGNTEEEGLMTNPRTAALDPIFYVHHSQIDRMWTTWNQTGGHKNPTDKSWEDGPTEDSRQFVMPMDNTGTPWHYTPAEVNSTTITVKTSKDEEGSKLYEYTYDDLSLVSGKKLLAAPPRRVSDKAPVLVGGSESVDLKGGKTEVIVRMDKAALMRGADPKQAPIYLQLEGVTGINNSNFLAIYINDIFVSSVALFGIRLASDEHSPHGNGTGLTFKFEISHLENQFDINNFKVHIEPRNPLLQGKSIKIGRVGIYL